MARSVSAGHMGRMASTYTSKHMNVHILYIYILFKFLVFLPLSPLNMSLAVLVI